MAKIIQLQRQDATGSANVTPVIVEDNWTVLRATEEQPLTEERIAAAVQGQDAVLFPLSVWKANEALLAGRVSVLKQRPICRTACRKRFSFSTSARRR